MATSAVSSEHFEKLHEIFRGLHEDLRGVPERLLGMAGTGIQDTSTKVTRCKGLKQN